VPHTESPHRGGLNIIVTKYVEIKIKYYNIKKYWTLVLHYSMLQLLRVSKSFTQFFFTKKTIERLYKGSVRNQAWK